MSLFGVLRRSGVAVAILVVTGSCGDPTGINALVPTLRVDPDTVAPGDTFHIAITIVNPTADTVWLGSGDSCWVLPGIERDGEPQPFGGTGWGCLTVVTNFPIRPGDSLFADFEMVALLANPDPPPYTYVVPPASGVYTVIALMHVGLPDLEAPLVVEPAPLLSSRTDEPGS